MTTSAPAHEKAPVVNPAVDAAGDEGKDRNPSRKQNPMTDDTAARPARREISRAIGDLMLDKPKYGASAQERAAWLSRKELLLAAIEEASR